MLKIYGVSRVLTCDTSAPGYSPSIFHYCLFLFLFCRRHFTGDVGAPPRPPPPRLVVLADFQPGFPLGADVLTGRGRMDEKPPRFKDSRTLTQSRRRCRTPAHLQQWHLDSQADVHEIFFMQSVALAFSFFFTALFTHVTDIGGIFFLNTGLQKKKTHSGRDFTFQKPSLCPILCK